MTCSVQALSYAKAQHLPFHVSRFYLRSVISEKSWSP